MHDIFFLGTSLSTQRRHGTLAFTVLSKNWCLGSIGWRRQGLDSQRSHKKWSSIIDRQENRKVHRRTQKADLDLSGTEEKGPERQTDRQNRRSDTHRLPFLSIRRRNLIFYQLYWDEPSFYASTALRCIVSNVVQCWLRQFVTLFSLT